MKNTKFLKLFVLFLLLFFSYLVFGQDAQLSQEKIREKLIELQKNYLQYDLSIKSCQIKIQSILKLLAEYRDLAEKAPDIYNYLNQELQNLKELEQKKTSELSNLKSELESYQKKLKLSEDKLKKIEEDFQNLSNSSTVKTAIIAGETVTILILVSALAVILNSKGK